MCGIAGFFGFENKNLIKRMCNTISHRGPDDYGYHVDKNICLGNRRLSIIDIKGGRQPIYNEDKSVVVVYNGEIYNFKEIREKLEKKGHRFSTNTDSEILVHGYEEYGHDILNLINGMFAFAIWDSRKRELFLARDRLGIKPLYYWWDGKNLIFASEIKAMLKCDRIKPEISRKALFRFLALRYIPGDLTIINGVKKLMPGHMISFKDNNLIVKQYWEVSLHEVRSSSESLIKKISWLLEDSVRMRLISDVPLGAFLSGGIDSSTVVGLMSKFSDKVKTFSVGFNVEKYNEIDYARIASEHLGTDHYEIYIDSEKFIKTLPKIVWFMDEPIGDPASIPTYYVAKLARKKVKVVLTGEGGDELFCGYPKYGMLKSEVLTKYYLKIPGFAKSAIMKALPGEYYLRFDSLETAERYYIAPFIKNAKILEKITESKGISEDILAVFKPYLVGGNTMREMQYVDIKTWLPEELLMKVDKMTMANSLEARVPFLDHRFVNFSVSVPTSFKIRQGTEKYILRESFKNILPEIILKRKKQGFSVPIMEWHNQLRDIILTEDIKSTVENYLPKRYFDHVKDASSIFNLIILNQWSLAFL